ncbi:S-adenosylmethionine decarboxylase [Aquipuribacter sp. MA13-6]|uniref:S-adenosylmethionine decarboxylase n=1 Tax=unclassified Aquipuribacter TaxID=2635084 RepID=UPI003EEF3A1C
MQHVPAALTTDTTDGLSLVPHQDLQIDGPHRQHAPMPDLAPMIHRQRLVIEGYCDAPISAEAIRSFLSELSDTIGMVSLMEPMTHQSPLYGWAGWIHWETSGAHFYAWDSPLLFFSVDVYACKPFQARDAVDLAARHFGSTPVWKEF